MEFWQYYRNRWCNAVTYTNSKWWYIIIKSLCMVVGLPLMAALFVIEMVLTAIYSLLSIIPIVNVVALVAFKVLTAICSVGYYIAILPDIKHYYQEESVDYDIQDNHSDTDCICDNVDEISTKNDNH